MAMAGKRCLWVCTAVLSVAVVLSVDVTRLAAQAPTATYVFDTTDPACQVATMVSTGGPMPRNPRTLAIRYAGWGNYELVYNGRVLLLDASFDRGSNYWPLGFQAADVKKVDAILIGHGHRDHMADAAWIASRTGAVVVGAPVTTQALTTPTLDPRQIRTVTGRGGEILELAGMRIEPILTRHSERDPTIHDHFGPALEATTTQRAPATPQLAAAEAAARERQSAVNDPRLSTEGTITFLITLDNGFRIFFRDSAGEVLDSERAAWKRIGGVDLGILAIEYTFLNDRQAQRALSYVRAYNPAIFMPTHHDGSYNELWRSTEPIFQTLKDEFPDIITISKQYREPVCINTAASRGRRNRE